MRFLKWLCGMDAADKIIRVKSWRPSRDPYGIAWPMLLVDRYGYQRQTVQPIWNRARLRVLFFGGSKEPRQTLVRDHHTHSEHTF